MDKLYPLKFKPIFKEKLWGGQKIKTILGKDFGDLDNCGETWELSGVPGNVSQVINGFLQGELLSDLVKKHQSNLVGKSVFDHFGDEFPLLIKFIDANQDLSVQVHPNDELAQARHGCSGKAEMWYVIQADDGATLINGFKSKAYQKSFKEHLTAGELKEILHTIDVAKADTFYLPGGRVHSIGKGILLAEIQQTSDITYRIYDFDRVDKHGNTRELHVEQALDAIDFSKPEQLKSEYETSPNQANSIVATPYFSTNKLFINQKKHISRTELDCFKIYIGVGGTGKIAGESIKFGEVILIPAILKEYEIEPDGELELLETYIEL